jgi:Flp pilus assembly protein TadB
MSDIEEIKALLVEIRDAQREHREEWKRAYALSRQEQEQAQARAKQARRNIVVIACVLVALYAITIVLPTIQWVISWAMRDVC